METHFWSFFCVNLHSRLWPLTVIYLGDNQSCLAIMKTCVFPSLFVFTMRSSLNDSVECFTAMTWP